MMQDQSVVNAGIRVTEQVGRARLRQPIRVGVPLPRNRVLDSASLYLLDAEGARPPAQFTVLERWPDTSIKWLLVDAQLALQAGKTTSMWLRAGAPAATNIPTLNVAATSSGISIDTGAAQFYLRQGAAAPFAEVAINAPVRTVVLDDKGSQLVLTDRSGRQYAAQINFLDVIEQGTLQATVVAEGGIRTADAKTVRVKLRLSFHAGSTQVRCEASVHNPQAARHSGGLWDLGDAGSIHFRDITVRFNPMQPVVRLRWRAVPSEAWREQAAASWVLYQDSSGGENWDSDNHLDCNSASSVTFRGYRVAETEQAKPLAEGLRATPTLCVQSQSCWLAATIEDFWQNFPKALRWTQEGLQLALFPRECRAGFELQGGEQKRHIFFLEFGAGDQPVELLPEPLVALDPEWVAHSAAVPYFSAAAGAHHDSYLRYVNSIIDGPHAFPAKREIIDEYGWRNFGDLYADHEAVKHTGSKPLVSHYNNQYDFVYGAAVQFLRSGDFRWWRLCADAARHHIDIDIYHTDRDKAAFNGGWFWHTDHYQPAATSTHRTYSRHNGRAGYGGGPSNEQNYTSGLLYYYYVSGDVEARDTVLGLAEWVIAMDDGDRNVFALLDNSPTGLASKTVSADYHHPGRGAGNSINALLDAYALSGARRYVLKAEELMQRCIHPQDDITLLKLDEPEYRWSYLVFLQVLGKYLDFKREWGELDYGYYYARDSLLHYAAWMAEHELPYRQQLHKVEIPTETWPAHDVRKAHVLHLAAKYAPTSLHARYKSRAEYFQQNCLQDLLSFATAYLTRPQVILCVYGHIDRYFKEHGDDVVSYAEHNYRFGAPQPFVAQRGRLAAGFRRKLRLLKEEVLRAMDQVWRRLRSLRAGR